jgi:hypothetical protein
MFPSHDSLAAGHGLWSHRNHGVVEVMGGIAMPATMAVCNVTARLTGEALCAKYTGGRVHPTPDEIGRLAYHFYVARGRRDGHDVDDWLLAERELLHHYR